MNPQDIIEYWFGGTDEQKKKLWWGKDAAIDAEIKQRFGAALEQAAQGNLQSWRETAEGCLALIILTDQMSRNMFRDTAQMYATDHIAIDVAQQVFDTDFHAQLPLERRRFAAMPFMHAEDKQHQARCVTLFQQLDPGGSNDYALRHQEIVDRFGRFPHRNQILGRTSTDEEEAFLKEPGSSF